MPTAHHTYIFKSLAQINFDREWSNNWKVRTNYIWKVSHRKKEARPKKMTERKRKKPHSVSRLESVQNSVFDVLNCHGQKLAHLPKSQCQTNLHFLQIKTDVYLVPFSYMHWLCKESQMSLWRHLMYSGLPLSLKNRITVNAL